MKSYYIYLYRNGLTDSNLEGKYIGHTDVPLSEDGIKQINQMKEDYEYPEVDVVFTSPLKRCTETAKLVHPDKTPLVINDLIEYNFGEYEGRIAEELKENELFKRWLSGEAGVEPPFGESNEAFAQRISDCFIKIVDGLLKTGTTKSAIFTHGGVIMYILAAFGIPEAPMHEWMMPCGCGYAIRITPGIWSRGRKFEAIAEVPYVPEEENEETE
ncbi:MAG: histidine phosphatase family protein [Clostridia bacterium]|nr:histidine phosphatase family protein [Clostridia bacterium]